MKKFSALVIVFLALCAGSILLMRSCGGSKPVAAPTPTVGQETPAPENTPEPTPSPTPVPTPSYIGSVWTTDGVNLRRGPGTDHEIIVSVEKDTQLERTGMADNGWSIVLYDGAECYVDSTYLTTTAPASASAAPGAGSFNVTACNDTVWTTDGVNLRRGPGTNYDIALAVDAGTELRRTGTTDNNWSRVIYQNVGYYVDSTYVSTVAPTPDPESEGAGGSETASGTENSAAATNVDATAASSGEFCSDTGTSLNLIVRWSLTGNADSSKKLTLNAYVSSYALQAAAMADDLCFKVGSNTYNFTSKGVNVEENTATETLLGTCSVDVSQASVPVAVTWHFNGTYSGQKIDDLLASATLTLGG